MQQPYRCFLRVRETLRPLVRSFVSMRLHLPFWRRLRRSGFHLNGQPTRQLRAIEMQSNPVDTFLQEADDLLAKIEAVALSMTGDRAGNETVNQIFRAFHTIKGSGAMFGFDDIAAFTHHVETLLDQVRDGLVPVSEELSNVILAATDQIKLLLAGRARGRSCKRHFTGGFTREGASTLCGSGGNFCRPHSASDSGLRGGAEGLAHSLSSGPRMLSRGGNPVLLFRDLKKLGDCVIEGHIDDLPALTEMQTDVCYLWWSIQLTTAIDPAIIQDVFMFVEDGSELRIEPAAEDSPLLAARARRRDSFDAKCSGSRTRGPCPNCNRTGQGSLGSRPRREARPPGQPGRRTGHEPVAAWRQPRLDSTRRNSRARWRKSSGWWPNCAITFSRSA